MKFPLSQDLVDRFWSHVVKTDGCWKWIGRKKKQGYGQILENGRYSKALAANRVSWAIHNGPIPDGVDVLHECDNPECTRPDHLFLGTHKRNMEDKVSKNRQWRPSGEKNPKSKLTLEDISVIRRRLSDGDSVSDIASDYKVGWMAISRIKRNISWRGG